jgi:D-tyrosyl-tRNA(Tyr) deacylase
MSNNTDPKIQEIEERHAAATPGPWTVHKCGDSAGYAVYEGTPNAFVKAITGWGSVLQSKENAELIAHAPTDIAYLLSEYNRLQTENETLKDAIETAHAYLASEKKMSAEYELERILSHLKG